MQFFTVEMHGRRSVEMHSAVEIRSHIKFKIFHTPRDSQQRSQATFTLSQFRSLEQLFKLNTLPVPNYRDEEEEILTL